MSTDIIIPQNFGMVASKFQQQQVENDLAAGIQSSFGIVGYKGKVWSIRYRGDETPLMREDGDGPKASIEVVIVKSSKHISKIWYENGYVEGSTAAPDCFSNNGIVPEPTSAKKQCDTCALCPHNAWGSRITPAGKAGKACSDSKRIAVVPAQDLENSAFGGPMLLRVPAASLQDLAQYGEKMQQLGYPYFSIATKISFDPAESYPKFKFSAVRPLDDAAADIILPLRDGHTVERILNENEYAQPAPQPDAQQSHEQKVAAAFEEPVAPKQVAQPAVDDEEAKLAAQLAALKAKKEAEAKAAAEAAQRKAAEEAAAKAAAEAQRKAAEEAAAKAATQPEEVDEEAALMAKLAALQAAKQATSGGNTGNAAATEATVQATAPDATQESTTAASNTGPTATASASPSDDTGNMASDFEANLDDMLSKLLPGS